MYHWVSFLRRQTRVARGLDQARIWAFVERLENNVSVELTPLDTAGLGDHVTFNATHYDYLVLTQAPLLPHNMSNVTSNYIQYLKDGGHVILMPPQLNVSKLADIAVNVMSDYEPITYTLYLSTEELVTSLILALKCQRTFQDCLQLRGRFPSNHIFIHF